MEPNVESNTSRNFIEKVLVLLLLLVLLYALYSVLEVFFGVFTFALIFYASFFKPYESLARRFGNRRKLTAVIYSLVLTVLIALPFIYIIAAMGKHIKDVLHIVDDIKTNGVPPLPDRIVRMPYLGDGLSKFWEQVRENPGETIAVHQHQLKMILQHIVTGGVSVLAAGLQVILGIIISAFLLVNGENTMRPIKSTLKHLLGERDSLVLLGATGNAIRGVSIGVIGTAIIATCLSWIGLLIAGIHFKLFLCAVIFFLVLIQVGPLIVWIPLVLYMASQDHIGMTIFLAAYGAFITFIDGILKPILIAKSGGKLPFLVLFFGVIGGLTAWGFTGMFKGAIILSVFYTIFNSWLDKKNVAASYETP
jgi:predicted PurR-regulated permease PerM